MDDKIKVLNQEIAKNKIVIILSSICEAILVILELYIMINYKSNFVVMAFGVLLMIVGLFFLINSLMNVSMKTKEIEQQKYEDIYNAQKASYLVIRKSFDEMEERLKAIEESSSLPAEEIISAQKAVAKVTISRSKENTDALMNSNDELINQLLSIQEKLEGNNSEIIEKQKELLEGTRNELQRKISELTAQVSNIEGKIASGAFSAESVSAPTPIVQPTYEQPAPEVTPEQILESAEPEISEDLNLDFDTATSEDISLDDLPAMEESVEEPTADIDLDIDLDSLPDVDAPMESEPAMDLDLDILDLDTNPLDESSEETGSTSVLDELGIDLDNLPDIDAGIEPAADVDTLLEEPIIEEPAVEETVVEEPILEEPIIEESVPEETVAEEPVIEEAMVEEAAAEPEPAPAAPEPVPIPDVGIDLSDPNRVMSPEEIEKLFASI